MSESNYARVNSAGVVVERTFFSGQAPDLSTGDKWLRIIRDAKPLFDAKTQKVEETRAVDLNAGTETHGWGIISVDLVVAKAARISAVVDLYNTKIAAGRLHNTKTYQIRPDDRENFLAVAVMLARAKLNPHGGTWRDITNAEITLNDVEMGALIDSVYAYLRDLRRAVTTHKEAIRAIGTVADVGLYDITTGWPANT